MTLNPLLIFLIASLLTIGCTPSKTPEQEFDEANDFVAVDKLSNRPGSAFLATLDSPIDTSKNCMYAASLSYCWHEIRMAHSPISNITNKDLLELHQSVGFLKTLKTGEYTSSITYEGDKITAKAFFKKILPFSEPFETAHIKFGDKYVKSFYFSGDAANAEMMFYRDSANFGVKLLPIDKEHEIILVMSQVEKNESLTEFTARVFREEQVFQSNPAEPNKTFTTEDYVNIPLVSFHLEHDYKNIVGSTLSLQNSSAQIVKCYQRTAFLLNESGAKAESEAEIVLDFISTQPIPSKIEPRELIFDRPYMIFLKRKDAKYPYFAFYVKDVEWMKKL